MPIKIPHTPAERQGVVKTEMHKFGEGALHSGSADGPVVSNPKQAIAIGLSEAGLSNRKPHGFGHKSLAGPHRVSGHPGAHRVGKR
jgi:uncharacterized protein DUF6496